MERGVVASKGITAGVVVETGKETALSAGIIGLVSGRCPRVSPAEPVTEVITSEQGWRTGEAGACDLSMPASGRA